MTKENYLISTLNICFERKVQKKQIENLTPIEMELKIRMNKSGLPNKSYQIY